jgi:hypothetical protein
MLVQTRQGSLLAHSRGVVDATDHTAQSVVASMPQLHLICWWDREEFN